MKKLTALLLALIMVFSLATVASADTYEDMATVTIDKTYTVTNPGTNAYPTETFAFTVTPVKVEDAGVDPQTNELVNIEDFVVTVDPIEFESSAETVNKQITVHLPSYKAVGIYTYTITETPGNTAGVTYHSDPITLVVTVIEQNGKIRVAAIHTETEEKAAKSDDIENVYSAGDLEFSKVVTGNLGDKDKYFDVTVTLTGDPAKVYQAIEIAGGSNTENATSVAFVKTEAAESAPATCVAKVTLKIKDGETITLKNIPYDVTYTIEEADYASEGYDPAHYASKVTIGTNVIWADEDDTINGEAVTFDRTINSAMDSYKITNNKESEVDTGIALDSMPFVLMLAVAVIGMGAIVIGKKRYEV